jgi:prevent-host-death family protein
MKTTNVKTAKNKLSELLRDTQLEHVVIMSHGRPIAIVLGVAGHDLETVFGMGEDLTQLQVRHSRLSAAKHPDRAITQDEIERRYLRRPARSAGGKRRKKQAA